MMKIYSFFRFIHALLVIGGLIGWIAFGYDNPETITVILLLAILFYLYSLVAPK